jgi:hypothetical protein
MYVYLHACMHACIDAYVGCTTKGNDEADDQAALWTMPSSRYLQFMTHSPHTVAQMPLHLLCMCVCVCTYMPLIKLRRPNLHGGGFGPFLTILNKDCGYVCLCNYEDSFLAEPTVCLFMRFCTWSPMHLQQPQHAPSWWVYACVRDVLCIYSSYSVNIYTLCTTYVCVHVYTYKQTYKWSRSHRV